MDEYTFTNEEKDRINYLYANGFEGITPEDAELIGKWEVWKAKEEADFTARQEAIKAESNLRLENARIEHQTAMDNLFSLRDAAIKRLERIENGQA